MEIASPLALPGATDRVIAAASAVERQATAALALLSEVIALRDKGDYVARMIGGVADLDGMRDALTSAIATCGTEQAAALADLADRRHRHGWDDRAEAIAAEMLPPILRAASGG